MRAQGWRQLVDPAADGAWNMAVDEALLEACVRSASEARPTLRLYTWQPPCLSLGRAQPSDGAHSMEWLRRNGVRLVRRPTGGAAVLHEHERTYAVVGSLRHAPFEGGVVATFEKIARAIANALGRLGIETTLGARRATAGVRSSEASCFAVLAEQEIAWRGHKLVGAAQLRRRGAFLQHGSILLRAEPERWAGALGREPAGPSPIGLEQVLGRKVDLEELDRALLAGFAEGLGARFEPGGLTPDEQARAARLASWKYGSASWTFDGRLGERERGWSGLR